MKQHFNAVAVAVLVMAATPGAQAADATYAVKLMAPETALKAAQGALKKCRDSGYQVAVAVLDRSGVPQVMLRDRYAGMHTPDAAVGKAWTAISFKTSSLSLAESTQAGKDSSGIRQIEHVLAVGGGILVEAGGVTFGGIGVSGAPNGAADEGCARAGLAAIAEDLEF
jgi:uncharacterized protein GlcG (DUF336 family)